MTQAQAKDMVLPVLRKALDDWVRYWVYQEQYYEHLVWYHCWPDATVFGPFWTREEAVKDCMEQARFFTG